MLQSIKLEDVGSAWLNLVHPQLISPFTTPLMLRNEDWLSPQVNQSDRVIVGWMLIIGYSPFASGLLLLCYDHWLLLILLINAVEVFWTLNLVILRSKCRPFRRDWWLPNRSDLDRINSLLYGPINYLLHWFALAPGTEIVEVVDFRSACGSWDLLWARCLVLFIYRLSTNCMLVRILLVR